MLKSMINPGLSSRCIGRNLSGKKLILVFVFILIMLLAMSSSLMATDYIVSGAGTAAVNGTYTENGTYNGKPQYQLGATSYYLKYNFTNRWEILSGPEAYYYTNTYGDTPPSTGWVRGMGQDPAPTVAEAVSRLTYNPETFQESSTNDGTIGNTLTITYETPGTDYFTGSNGTFASSKYTATNVPAGLTMAITKNSNLELSVALTGTATNSNNANDISNLEIVFDNSAFNDGNASAVSNSTKSDINVNFIQQYEVASSEGDYTTIAAAISDADNGDILDIAAETFTEAALLTIDKDLTIQGQGAEATIVQANATQNTATYGVFQIESGTTVSISAVTIRHGKAQCGGGINNSGTLTLSGSVVCNNNADHSNYEHSGGGIYNSGTLTVNNCTINDNTTLSSSSASGYGGGIHVGGNITITNSTINNNSSLLGSGIYCNGSSITTTITNSTITANNNKTATTGGGIAKYSGCSLTLTNCTVTNNSGGIWVNFGTFEVRNTILADNSTSDYHVANGITLNDNGYNIVENQTKEGSPSNWYFDQSSDILYSHDYLGNTEGASGLGWNRNDASISGSLNLSSTLADNNTTNGTQTLKTTSGSFAINAGTDTGAPTTDQRGAGRNGATDIGAYEWWDDDASLPVELSSFTAENRSNGILLKWSTESEIENLGFLIEKQILDTGCWMEIAGYLTDVDLEGHGSTTEAHEYQFTDKAVQPGVTYEYRLGDVDYSGKVTWHDKIEIKVKIDGAKIPTEFGLQRAYPNPFNPTTTISYQLASASLVKISIYDVSGKLVETLVNEQKDRGSYSLVWDAGGLSSGIYFYRIAAGEYSKVNKCLLIR